MCVFCISNIPILKCTIYILNSEHRFFPCCVDNIASAQWFTDTFEPTFPPQEWTFLNMQNNGSNQANGCEWICTTTWCIGLMDHSFVSDHFHFSQCRDAHVHHRFLQKKCVLDYQPWICCNRQTHWLLMSLYYMLQKRPILWTNDARSACRNTQYCGQAMQDRLRNVAFWLDLRMICDASTFQIFYYHITN